MRSQWMELVPCHRIPDRCLLVKGKRMPICSRCLAILIGYSFTPIAVMLGWSISLWVWLMLTTPMIVDGFSQKWGWRKSNQGLRLVTGLLFGVSQSLLISTIVWRGVGWLLNMQH